MNTQPAPENKSTFIHLTPLVVVLLINAGFLWWNAFRCFNFFDMGSFLDAAWRVYQGQLPYRDFIYFSGPIHLYIHTLFFLLFGFGKAAILAHLITLSSIVIAVIYTIVRKNAPVAAATVSALLTGIAFYWPISHPWYDESAHWFGILAIGAVFLIKPASKKREAGIAGVTCGVLCMFSFFTKTNIGTLYILAFFFILLTMDSPKWRIGWYGIGLCVSFMLNLAIIRVPGLYYEQAFVDFGLINVHRFSDMFKPRSWLDGNYWIMAVLTTATFVLNKNKAIFPFVTFWSILIVAAGSAISASMIREANIPLQGVLMGLTFVNLYQNPANSGIRKVQQALLGLAFICSFMLILIGVYYGLILKVWTYIGKPPAGNYALKAPVLRGWMCDRETGQDLDKIVEFVNRNVPKTETLLILSDLQILNALTGRNGYRGVPFIFTQGKVPTPGKQLEKVRNQIMQNPPDWVLTHIGDSFSITYLIQYLDLFDFLHEHYTPFQKWQGYIMLRKKPAVLHA